MVNKEFLFACKSRDIAHMRRDELVDISSVKTEGSSRKLEGFLKTVKNPYCFRVKNTPVKVVFSDAATAPEIETALVNIANRRMG